MFRENKMQLIKSKKAGEPTTLSEIIGWIIVIVLILFVFLWNGGLGTKITSLYKYFYQSFI